MAARQGSAGNGGRFCRWQMVFLRKLRKGTGGQCGGMESLFVLSLPSAEKAGFVKGVFFRNVIFPEN